MERKLKVFAALHEESNEGWIWLDEPGVPSRTIIEIRNRANGCIVHCALREIDGNFRRKYEARCKIKDQKDVALISAWYRDALGIKGTQESVTLDLREPCWLTSSWWPIRASCQHPEISVRLGTRLGVLGTWLGIAGLALSAVPGSAAVGKWIVAAVMVVLAIPGIAVCRGVRRPKQKPRAESTIE